MTIKSILCIFGGDEDELNALNTALILAKSYHANIRFLHISPDPTRYAVTYNYGEAYAYGALIEACEKENAQQLKKAQQSVAFFCSQHDIPLDDKGLDIPHLSARFLHFVGYPQTIIAREGRISDLIIMGRSKIQTTLPYDSNIVAALFDTARPVVVMPKTESPGEWKSKTVALAWDGSLEAARSLFNSLSLVEKTEKFYVLVLRSHNKPVDVFCEQGVMEYLRAHGFNPNVMVIDREQHSTGEALLNKARELKADALIMGAYGHSRVREMFLGGVTNYMLEKANIPLILSH